MTPLKSSTIAAVGYDPGRQVMTVQFNSRPEPYDFHGVPPELHEQFMAAPSPGSFFHQNFRGKFTAPAPASSAAAPAPS